MAVVEIKVSPAANGVKTSKVEETKLEQPNQPKKRGTWENKAEFVLTCIGLSVGIGNVWRFPYLAYQNGGGAYLVAYTIMLIIAGKPLFFAELAIGQFTSQSAMKAWRCFPLAKGIGVAMIVMSVVVGIYYNVIMCYTLYYGAQSFRSVIPWKECFSWWGADENCYVRRLNQTNCWELQSVLSSRYADRLNISYDYDVSPTASYDELMKVVPTEVYQNELRTCNNATQTASEQFWEKKVLQLTPSINDIGHLKWDLALTLFICWMINFLCLMKGIQSAGKIVYFTATFPYVILITLVIYGCTLEGAIGGLKYFFIPNWKKLLDISVWRAAAEQLLFSLSIGWGCLIMNASYNKFDNKLYKDAVLISILDFATSIVAGVVIFSVLGYLSHQMKIDISKVAKGGQGLAFVTYPEALATLPVPQLWSVLFFFMLFLLAIDSEISYLENVFTAIYDDYPYLRKKKTILTFGLCMIFFLLGLPFVTQGGQYILNLMDVYGGGYAGVIVATFETVALMWGYGADRFSYDIKFMLGTRPNLYWRICWKYLSPIVLLFVLIYSLSVHKVITYGGNGEEYPMWAEYLGWMFIMVSVLQIPIWALVQVYRYRKDLKGLLRPDPDWGPHDPDIRRRYQEQYALDCAESNSNSGVENLGMESIPEDRR